VGHHKPLFEGLIDIGGRNADLDYAGVPEKASWAGCVDDREFTMAISG